MRFTHHYEKGNDINTCDYDLFHKDELLLWHVTRTGDNNIRTFTGYHTFSVLYYHLAGKCFFNNISDRRTNVLLFTSFMFI